MRSSLVFQELPERLDLLLGCVLTLRGDGGCPPFHLGAFSFPDCGQCPSTGCLEILENSLGKPVLEVKFLSTLRADHRRLRIQKKPIRRYEASILVLVA